MVYVAELARLAGRLDDDDGRRGTAAILSSARAAGHATAATAGPACYDAMKRDKKNRGSMLRFVVLDGVARPTRLEGPDPALLSAAYAEVSRD